MYIGVTRSSVQLVPPCCSLLHVTPIYIQNSHNSKNLHIQSLNYSHDPKLFNRTSSFQLTMAGISRLISTSVAWCTSSFRCRDSGSAAEIGCQSRQKNGCTYERQIQFEGKGIETQRTETLKLRTGD